MVKSSILLSAALSVLLFSTQSIAYDTIAKHALLMDSQTGQVLFEKDANVPMAPASMSKLMTTYVLFEALQNGQLSLDDTFNVSENAWRKGGVSSGSSTMFLEPNTSVKVSDLLRGIIVQSGNDACIVVAENMAGSEEAFAELLTQKAKALGLEHSTFKNATGLPDKNHKMSAKDLALLARLIMTRFPEYFSIYSEKSFTYNGITQGNRNPLLYSLKGANGMKTGHTKEAGYSLTGTAKTDDGRDLIIVLNGLNSMKDRQSEAQKLMSYGMIGFENKEYVKKGDIITQMPVFYGVQESINAIASEGHIITQQKAFAKTPKMTIMYESPIPAPVKFGQKIGTLVIEGENGVKTIDLVAEKGIEKVGFMGKIINLVRGIF